MLDLILLTSLVSIGLFVSGYEGYILFHVRDFIAKSFGGVQMINAGERYYEFNNGFKTFWKPLWGCPPCMASFWGIIVYLLFESVGRETIYELPVLILASSGLNFIIFNNMVKKWLND